MCSNDHPCSVSNFDLICACMTVTLRWIRQRLLLSISGKFPELNLWRGRVRVLRTLPQNINTIRKRVGNPSRTVVPKRHVYLAYLVVVVTKNYRAIMAAAVYSPRRYDAFCCCLPARVQFSSSQSRRHVITANHLHHGLCGSDSLDARRRC